MFTNLFYCMFVCVQKNEKKECKGEDCAPAEQRQF